MREPTVRTQKIHRNYLKLRLIIFGGLALALVIASYFSESLCPYDPYLQDLGNAKAIPSAAHLFGTDRYGRDMLSRVIVGSKTSIYSTLLLVGFIMVFGTMIGIFCAWSRKKNRFCFDAYFRCFSGFSGSVFALAVAAAAWRVEFTMRLLHLRPSAGQSMRVLQGVKRWHKKKQFI